MEAGGGAQLGAPGSWTVKLAQEEKGMLNSPSESAAGPEPSSVSILVTPPTTDLGLVLQTPVLPFTSGGSGKS